MRLRTILCSTPERVFRIIRVGYQKSLLIESKARHGWSWQVELSQATTGKNIASVLEDRTTWEGWRCEIFQLVFDGVPLRDLRSFGRIVLPKTSRRILRWYMRVQL